MPPTPKVLPSVTVVVCTRDRPERLRDCLAGLRTQDYPGFEILVVDNASADPVAGLCEQFGARCVRAPLPGLTRARNVGALHARGEIVAYIDDDAIVEAGWLRALVADFSDAAVGAVTGRVRYMAESGTKRAMSSQAAADDQARARARFDRSAGDWFATAAFGGIGDGGNMAFRRRLLASGGAFDERLGRGRAIDSGDEHVLFARILGDGHAIAHNPEAIVRHPGPATETSLKLKRQGDLRSAIAYLLFLWVEFPAKRNAIVRFVATRLLKRIPGIGRRRRRARMSLFQAGSAMLGGIRDYASSTAGSRASSRYPVPAMARATLGEPRAGTR